MQGYRRFLGKPNIFRPVEISSIGRKFFVDIKRDRGKPVPESVKQPESKHE